MISYLQYFELVNDRSELRKLVKSRKNKSFADKVKLLEDFYEEHGLGNIAVPVHDVKYLFTFLENNGFYTTKNSLQSKKYYQQITVRKLEDTRLYLSEQLLDHINGHEYEAIVDEIEYNSELEDGLYKDPDKDISKLINKSEETEKTIAKRYKTDTKLRNNALDNSGYICEIGKLKGMECKTFPSRRYEGDYAEVHHLIPMHAQEDDLFVQEDKLISLDQISNLIVLCPTCHSKLHYGKSSDVKPDLELLFEYRKEALIQNKLILKKQKLLEFYKI
jgi:predicted HNH restriction endonuclease